MNSAQAVSHLTVSQANVAADACSGITNCVNLHDNDANIVGAPLATQNINVDGSQSIDQSNTCSDDNLGVPGAINCINNAQLFGNDFVVANLNGAGDVLVDNFEQASTQANTCTLFDNCINVAGNALAIAAEDNDGVAATNVDAFVGSSVQTTTQGNDCNGSAIFPDPQCTNVDLNFIGIAALVDGDVNLEDSTQTSDSNNNCDVQQVICNNAGTNVLVMVANGENAETDLATNEQTSDKTNDCVNVGTSCTNGALNTAVLTSTDDAFVDISANSQTSGQANTCDTGAVCSNSALNGFVAAASGTSTLTGSNTQAKSQSNTCSAAGCVNIGDNLNIATAEDDSTVSSVSSQSDSGTNTCTNDACLNIGVNHNTVAGSADASIASTSSQSNDFTNTCTFAACGNSNANVNTQVGGAGAEFESDVTQTSSNTNECEDATATCNNVGANTVEIS
jgi:hypothetical protein